MVKKNIDIFTRFTTNVRGFTKSMAMPIKQFRKMENEAGGLDKRFSAMRTSGGRLGSRIRLMTHGFRGFRMEMLGVMFFGMGLQRFFMGLLSPALKLAGVFQLFSTVLSILFLPIALLLLDVLMPIFTWLMNLSEGTKLWLGKIVLIGVVLGGALFIIGMFALGIGSMILAFGSLLGIIEKIFPEPLGDFAAAFIGLPLAMGGIGIGVSLFEMLKGAISSVWDKLIEIPAFQKLMEQFGFSVEGMETPWETLKTKVGEFFTNLAADLGITTQFNEFTNSVTGLKDQFSELWDQIKEIDFKKLADSFNDFVLNIAPGLITALTNIASVLAKIADSRAFGLLNKVLGFAGRGLEAIMTPRIGGPAVAGFVGGAIVGGPPAAAIGGIMGPILLDVLQELRFIKSEINSAIFRGITSPFTSSSSQSEDILLNNPNATTG